NGKVFNAGPNTDTAYLDTSGFGAWTSVGATNSTAVRLQGSAVMYENGKIMVVGGIDPPTASAEVIDLNQANPTWQLTSPMSVARRQLNTTALPDGTVLVTGGTTSPGF